MMILVVLMGFPVHGLVRVECGSIESYSIIILLQASVTPFFHNDIEGILRELGQASLRTKDNIHQRHQETGLRQDAK